MERSKRAKGNAGKTERARDAILAAITLLYPAALRGVQVQRMVGLPSWTTRFKRQLAALVESGHLRRIVGDDEPNARATPWRNRWLRLADSEARRLGKAV